MKLDVFRRYAKWAADGKKLAESPYKDLKEDYPTIGKNYPKYLHDKCMASGSIENQWSSGPDVEFDQQFFENHMMPVIREYRGRQRVAPLRAIVATIKKKKKGQRTPSRGTVAKAKRDLGLKHHVVKKKPKLNASLWKQRLAMAQRLTGVQKNHAQFKKLNESAIKKFVKYHARKVKGDEKWMSEEKGSKMAFEARKESPVPANISSRRQNASHGTNRLLRQSQMRGD